MSTGPTSLEEMARQALWELSAEAAGIGTYVLYLPSRELLVDDRVLELSGLDREHFSGRPEDVYARMHPEDVGEVIAKVERAVATGEVYSAEYRVPQADGTMRWIAARGQSVTDQAATVTALVGALYDITALREATTRVSEVLESMAVGYLAMDSDWRITYVNAEGRRVLGATGREIVGEVIWELYPATVGTEYERSYRRAVQTGQVVTFDAYYPAPLDAWFELRATPEAGGLGLYFLDITARRAAEAARDVAVHQQITDAQTMAGLVAAARDLGVAGSEDEVLKVITDRGASLLGAQGVGLALVEPGQDRVRTSATSFDAEFLAAVRYLPLDFPLPLVATAVTGQGYFFEDLASTAARFPAAAQIYPQTGTQASAALPLRARGHLLGSFLVAMDHAHHWRQPEKDLLEAFAALTAQALDRLAAGQAEHAATELARRAAAQQAALSAIAYALQASASEAEVLAVVSGRGANLVGAAGVGLAVLEPDRAHVRVLASDYFTDDLSARIARLPADAGLPIVRAAVDGTAFFLTDAAAADALFPGVLELYAAARTEGSAEVPLRAGGTAFGTLSVAFAQPHTWQASERDLLEAFAALTAQTLARIASREAEHTASTEVARFSETMQRSLLTSPAQPDHLQIAVRYAPAAAQAQVGGDWYDAFLTADGATSLVIGDVTGHDQQAAAAMGQLRNMLRGIGHATSGPPAAVLSALDRAVHDLAVGVMATVVIAQIEQTPAQRAAGLRTLRWSNAGHPPPLLIAPDGRTRYLQTAPELLLGLDPRTPRTDHTVVLQPGSGVLLFTDGLVERRDAPLQAGLDWLASTVAGLAHLSLDELCEELLTCVGDRVEDDVALLAVRAHPEDGPRPPGAGPTLDPTRAATVPSEHHTNPDDAPEELHTLAEHEG